MFKPKWILLIIAIAGVIILLLPDKGHPLIAFNKAHGPSFQDLIGLALILISWLFGVFLVVKNWNKIKTRVGTKNVLLFLSIYLLSFIGIVMALKTSLDWILWPCVTIALLINILFVILSFAKKNI